MNSCRMRNDIGSCSAGLCHRIDDQLYPFCRHDSVFMVESAYLWARTDVTRSTLHTVRDDGQIDVWLIPIIGAIDFFFFLDR